MTPSETGLRVGLTGPRPLRFDPGDEGHSQVGEQSSKVQAGRKDNRAHRSGPDGFTTETW